MKTVTGFYFKYDEKTEVLTQHMAEDDRMIGEWPDVLKETDFNIRHLQAENDPEVDKYIASRPETSNETEFKPEESTPVADSETDTETTPPPAAPETDTESPAPLEEKAPVKKKRKSRAKSKK